MWGRLLVVFSQRDTYADASPAPGEWDGSRPFAKLSDRSTLGALRRAAEAMGWELVYALVPKSGAFTELAERAVGDSAARDVKSVVHTMMLEDQKPENADQLIEDKAQRRLNRNKPR